LSLPRTKKTISIVIALLCLGCQQRAWAWTEERASTSSARPVQQIDPLNEILALNKTLLASSAQGSTGATSAAQAAAAQTAKSSAAATQPPPLTETSPPAQSALPTLAPMPGPTATSPQAPSSTPADSSPQSATSATRAPVLRENVVHNNSMASPDNKASTVESFFDCDAVPPIGQQSRPPGGTDAADNKSGWHAGRLIWHVLDNAGVPMFFGNRDADLDPKIGSRAYINPPDRVPSQTLGEKIRRKSVKTVVQSKPDSSLQDPTLVATPADPKTILHKIPQSELEGIDESQNPNQMQTPPVTPDAHLKTP
jgi:hypothetical protein